ATTELEDLLPGTLNLHLPEGLSAQDSTELTGELAADEPLVLTVPATGDAVGEYDVPATLDPWNLVAEEQVRVIEPVVIPEAPPELPDFKVERMSTVTVNFQAEEVARCELDEISAGNGHTLNLNLTMLNVDEWDLSPVKPL